MNKSVSCGKGIQMELDIVRLGQLKRQIDFDFIKQWKSEFFEIKSILEIHNIPNFEDMLGWQHLHDDLVRSAVTYDKNRTTIVITEYSLEDNFYMRRIDKGLIIISFFEIGDILQSDNIPFENFIIKNIYEIVTLELAYPDLPNTRDEIPDIIHYEPRGCLFDMNGMKTDIIYSTRKLILCPQCTAFLHNRVLPQNFIKGLISEIKKIKKPFYYRISDLIKRHPLWAILIAITSQVFIGIVAGLLANYLFKWIP
jgi:hypothetical protein